MPSHRKADIGLILTCTKIFILIGCHLIHRSSSANQFAAMRLQSNQARGPFQQLRLAIQCNLTCQLYLLYYRIERIKSKLEVSQTTLLAHHTYLTNSSQLAIDEQQLRIFSESTTRTAMPSPAAGKHILYFQRRLLTIFLQLLQTMWSIRLPC